MNKENTIDLCELVKCNKQQEIDRLNNIISELEKWLKGIQLTVLRSDNMPVYQYQKVLDKLNELKENNLNLPTE